MNRSAYLVTALLFSFVFLATLSPRLLAAETNLNKTEEIVFRQMEAMRAGGKTMAGPGFVEIPPNQAATIFSNFSDSEMDICVTVINVLHSRMFLTIGDPTSGFNFDPYRAWSVCRTLGNVFRDQDIRLACPEGAPSSCWAIWRVDVR